MTAEKIPDPRYPETVGDLPYLIRLADCAGNLGISRTQALRMAKTDGLPVPTHKIGNTYFVLSTDLVAFLLGRWVDEANEEEQRPTLTPVPYETVSCHRCHKTVDKWETWGHKEDGEVAVGLSCQCYGVTQQRYRDSLYVPLDSLTTEQDERDRNG